MNKPGNTIGVSEIADEKHWNVISLGAGVQSSTMALMASRGELLGIQVDFAIFADTRDEPEEFEKATRFEKRLQVAKASEAENASTLFLHNSRRPLDQIDFRSDVERGQQVFDVGDECEGMCGV